LEFRGCRVKVGHFVGRENVTREPSFIRLLSVFHEGFFRTALVAVVSQRDLSVSLELYFLILIDVEVDANSAIVLFHLRLSLGLSYRLTQLVFPL